MFGRIIFLACILAGSSAAFAVQQHPASTFAVRSNVNALKMTGGAAVSNMLDSPELSPPPALYQGAVAAGAKKAQNSFSNIFKLGIVAGCHIAFGAFLVLSVGAACPGIASSNPGLQKIIMGAFGLPFGLIMTLVTGAELFTGNTALVTAALMEGKIKKEDLVKNWTASFLGNFVGSLFMAFLVYQGQTLGSMPGAVNIATAKTFQPWSVNFVRGILCNWLVCMAVYMASGCKSLIGKMTAVWFPISAFVALGLDHSVANMFLLPLGIMRGAEITIGQMFLKNLIPVTLGNILGGAFFVMAPFGTTLGNWGKKSE